MCLPAQQGLRSFSPEGMALIDADETAACTNVIRRCLDMFPGAPELRHSRRCRTAAIVPAPVIDSGRMTQGPADACGPAGDAGKNRAGVRRPRVLAPGEGCKFCSRRGAQRDSVRPAVFRPVGGQLHRDKAYRFAIFLGFDLAPAEAGNFGSAACQIRFSSLSRNTRSRVPSRIQGIERRAPFSRRSHSSTGLT
jgi:hypothetical protein